MLKAAVRGLASGEKGFESLQKKLKKSVVFLNVYTRSVAEEHDPRGPDGPYQFKDRSVPVYVIKKWSGETFTQSLGFSSDQKAGNRGVAKALEDALKKNGPITAPKAMRPLLKAFARGEKNLGKKQPGWAWSEFNKVVELGNNSKKFPGGPPALVAQAQAVMMTIEASARGQLDLIQLSSDDNPKKAKAALTKLKRLYGRIPDISREIKDAIASLPKK